MARPVKITALPTLVEQWQAYLESLVSSGELAKTSARTYRLGLGRFIDHVGPITSVSAETVREWKSALLRDKYGPATINTWIAGVRHFFTWLAVTDQIESNPLDGIKGATRKGTNRSHKRDSLTNTEVGLLLDTAPQTTGEKRNQAILHLMAFCALRQIEIHRANTFDIKTQQGRLTIKVQGKGQKEASDIVVIANKQAETALYAWLAERGDTAGPLFTSLSNRSKDKRLSLRAIRFIVKRAYRRVGIRGKSKTTHSLRHTAISSAISHGAPVQKVQAMARHADISTTMIYYHETDRLEDPAEQYIDYKEDK